MRAADELPLGFWVCGDEGGVVWRVEGVKEGGLGWKGMDRVGNVVTRIRHLMSLIDFGDLVLSNAQVFGQGLNCHYVFIFTG